MERFVLTDAQWAKMEPHCLGKPMDPGRSGSDNRRFVEAVLWIARTGSPWRDLPSFFGNWNSVFKRYRDWVKAGVFVGSVVPSENPDSCVPMMQSAKNRLRDNVSKPLDRTPAGRIFPKRKVGPPVCTENLIGIDWGRESPNLGRS